MSTGGMHHLDDEGRLFSARCTERQEGGRRRSAGTRLPYGGDSPVSGEGASDQLFGLVEDLGVCGRTVTRHLHQLRRDDRRSPRSGCFKSNAVSQNMKQWRF
jgi:hypothetical protein